MTQNKTFKFFDEITSDVVFEAYGKTLEELFKNAADALMTVICKVDQIEPKVTRHMEVKGDSIKGLLYEWLQSLISEVDIIEMFFCEFHIDSIDQTNPEDIRLKATMKGEPLTPEKGETVVKAVTYHQFEFKETPDGFMCRVSLDI